LGQYRPGLGAAHVQDPPIGDFAPSADPVNGFARSSIVTEVNNVIDEGLAPESDGTPTGVEPIYVLFTPPDVPTSDQSGAGGYHTKDTDIDFSIIPPNPVPQPTDFDRIAFAWVGTSGGLDATTALLSHEVAEAMSDANADKTGLSLTPGSGGDQELCDGEAQNHTFRLNGVLVQSYWLAAVPNSTGHAGSYVIPDGNNTQNFWVDPFGDLVVRGDQLGAAFADQITISTTSTGGVMADLNGYTASFDPGAIKQIDVRTGAGSNTVVLQASKVPVSIDDQGNDTVILGNATHGVQDIAASVNIFNSPGSQTALTLDNSADQAGGHTAIITATGTTGLGPGNISYAQAVLTSLKILGGNGVNTYDVESTPTNPAGLAIATTLNLAGGRSILGIGTNTVNVGSSPTVLASTLDFIAGPLAVLGGRGVDRLNINDQGALFAHSYTLTGGNPTILQRSGAAPISYDQFVDKTVINGTNHGNTFTLVAPLPSNPVVIDGGGSSSSLQGPNLTNTWKITGTDSGTLGKVTFQAMDKLIGGSQADTFQFLAGGHIVQSIDGGPGTNTLDYSLWGSGATVNLGNGTADGVGSVLNIQDITGSPFNDNLTGDGGPNAIAGNGGNDVLSGAGGNDLIVLAANQGISTVVDGGTGINTLKSLAPMNTERGS
jgi:hypothetical protein